MVIALELSTKLLYFPSQACKKHFKILTLQKLFKGLRQSQLGTSQSAIKKIIERKVKKGIKKKNKLTGLKIDLNDGNTSQFLFSWASWCSFYSFLLFSQKSE